MNTLACVSIGMGAWDIEPYRRLFYPALRERQFRMLEFYSRYFDCVEVNATFYNAGFTPQQSKKWLDDVSARPEFTFLIKLFRGLTHTFTATAADVRAIRAFLAPIEESGKLGGLLLQFPFRFVNLQEHRRYIAMLGRIFRGYRVFVEVRHNSWSGRATVEFFEEQGLTPVNVDLPHLHRHMPLTAVSHNGYAYFRMMGRNAAAWNHPEVEDRYTYNYSADELDELLRKIVIVSKTARRVYVIFHNDAKGHSLVNGFTVRHTLARADVAVPGRTAQTFPELAKIGSVASLPAPLFDMQGLLQLHSHN